MIRNKYIRFFISSTFDDMKLERNLLQQVFDELELEFQQKGWQIETIDLRWGISQEASLDNKTIQICTNEIKRCQELSPKPNFIILLGNRYGWIPLPEIIAENDFKNFQINSSERKLLDDWYQLDENALPSPIYLLKERTGRYEDYRVWEQEVEVPLGNIFKHCGYVGYGASATELEINNGALNVNDAKEHVIAYFRDLYDIPDSDRNFFIDSDKERSDKLRALKERLHKKLDKGNTINYNLPYEEYLSSSFAEKFKTDIKTHLASIINTVISNAEKDNLDDENFRHIQIAEEEAKSFVGREKELEEIRHYLLDTEDRSILWYKSDSGSGKTALLAKTYDLFKNTYDILCRFCGQTPKSLYLHNIKGDVKTAISSAQRPLLIILDALNQTDDSIDILNLFDFNKELPLGVKIIMSSTDDYHFNFDKPFVRFRVLQSMGTDSWLLVNSLLRFNNRRLSQVQEQITKATIESSDKSALYLHMLGHFLSKMPSWYAPSKIPVTFEEVVKTYLSELSQPKRHGELLIRRVFSYLCAERIGLSQKEVLGLLAADEEYWQELKNNAKHPIEQQRRVPSVIWSRLEYDLTSFLRSRNTIFGQLYLLFHQQLKDFLNSYYHKDNESVFCSHKGLYYYYLKHAALHERHSLYEVCWQGYCSTLYAPNSERRSEIALNLFKDLTRNLNFLCQMMKTFPNRLWESYELVHSLFDDNGKQILKQVKLELSDYDNHMNKKDLFLLYSRVFPTSSTLRRQADIDYSDTVMPNILSDTLQENTTIHIISSVGSLPMMSEDGNRVAALFDAGHEVRIFDCMQNKNVTTYKMREEILEIQSDDTLRYNALRTRTHLIVWDNETRKTIITHHVKSQGNIWFSLSRDGQTLAVGDGEYTYFYYANKEQENSSYYVHTLSGKITPSGAYLWSIAEDGIISKIDIITGSGKTCGKANIEKGGNKVCKIMACTDNWVSYYDGSLRLLYHYIDENGKHNYSHISNSCNYEFVWPCIDENYFFIARVSGISLLELKYDSSRKDYYFEEIEHSFIDNVDFNKGFGINRKGDRALIFADNHLYIINLTMHLKQFHTEHDGNAGINNMCCSADGNKVLISTGINHVFDYQRKIFYINNGDVELWKPPFKQKEYHYVAGTAISPDGSHIAASSFNGDYGELLLTNSTTKKPKCCFKTKDSCIALRFSSDNEYLIAKTGHYIADPDPKLYLLDSNGRLLLEKQMDSNFPSKQHICFSPNNRYVLSHDFSGRIFDVLTQKILFEDKDFYFFYNKPRSDFDFKHMGIAVLLPYSNIVLANDSKSGKLLILNIEDEDIIETPYKKQAIACSPSGIKIFFLNRDNGELSMSRWPLNGNFEVLMNNVEYIVPALDDNHIFILSKDLVISLMNIETHRIEQQAYFGWTRYIAATKHGVMVANEYCEVGHFKPSDCYHVNAPAIATFVRHWNLNTNHRQEPVAICPACGQSIAMPNHLRNVIKTAPLNIYPPDFENPLLDGYICPYCQTTLRFNPYMT